MEVSADVFNVSRGVEDEEELGMEEDTVPLLESCIQLVKRRLQATTGPPRPAPSGNPPSPSPVRVKDEPVDEEYNQALFLPHPSSSSVPTDSIKDEPEAPNELMISSVFSVEGRSSSTRLMPKPSLPLPTLGPPPSSSSSSSATSTTLSMMCSFCDRFLIKSQTAYQRKGSLDIFCSPTCLSAKPQEAAVKICHHCCKCHGGWWMAVKVSWRMAVKVSWQVAVKVSWWMVDGRQGVMVDGGWPSRPVPWLQDLILTPVDGGSSVQDFCSTACLAACSPKLRPAPQKKQKAATLAVGLHTHVCFLAFCTAHKLSPGTCACCGEAFTCQPVVLKVATGHKNLCSDACLATYKQKGSFSYACSMCETMTPLSDSLDAKNSQGVVELFCTSNCLLACRIRRISAELACNHCSLYKVPSYHLVMSDNSIRNFCSLPCVLGFQDNSTTALPAAATPAASPTPTIATTIQHPANTKTTSASSSTTTSIIAHPTTTNNNNVLSTTTSTSSTSSLTEAASKSAVPKLLCPVCNCAITACPELIQEKDSLVFLCGLECAEEYKTLQGQESSCEYCKLLKVPADVKRIGSKDCSFCSEGCKQLYKHELAKQWGSHCRCCAYCFSISRAMVTTRYSGKNEEFCSEHCRNKYTLLIQQVRDCTGLDWDWTHTHYISHSHLGHLTLLSKATYKEYIVERETAIYRCGT
ncbi:hypothetical protein CRUP_019827 [Coryphaenoides rupestris]|nr:hypothetical protein CRUP_019827 [Coryphaenoides rupestris]